ncbi:hypothetical protein [Petrotoga sp. DB-2]
MILIVCSTPIQIMNALNLKLTLLKNKAVDLIILDHSKDNVIYYEELKKFQFFNELFFLKSRNMSGGNSEIKWIRYLKTANHYLRKNELLKQSTGFKKKYEEFFVCYPDIPSEIIYYLIKKNNPSVRLNMLEEGIFAYTYFLHKYSLLRRMFTNFIFGGKTFKNYQKAYIYRPDFMEESGENIELKKLPFIDRNNNEIVQIFNNVFEYKNTDNTEWEQKVFYFDQPLQFQSINATVLKLVDFINAKLSPKFRLNIKLHPRTDKNKFGNKVSVIQTRVPFELVVANNEVKDKILISVFSSACLNPKIMFDEEPYVILLYKLVDLSMLGHNERIFNIAHKVKESYKAKNKFFIPETFEELSEILVFLLYRSQQNSGSQISTRND